MKAKEPNYKYNNVMLVDDNALDNFINEKMIECNHFAKKVYVHSSAKSGLEFLKNLVTIGGSYGDLYPDIIFVDINMPVMDGFQFIEEARKSLFNKLKMPRLVILTSSVYHEDKQKAAAISSDIVFLNKPLSTEVLKSI